MFLLLPLWRIYLARRPERTSGSVEHYFFSFFCGSVLLSFYHKTRFLFLCSCSCTDYHFNFTVLSYRKFHDALPFLFVQAYSYCTTWHRTRSARRSCGKSWTLCWAPREKSLKRTWQISNIWRFDWRQVIGIFWICLKTVYLDPGSGGFFIPGSGSLISDPGSNAYFLRA